MHLSNRCNDTRGWFPSNYVEVIEEDVLVQAAADQQDQEEEEIVRNSWVPCV